MSGQQAWFMPEMNKMQAEIDRLAKWKERAEYLMTENPNAHASEILAVLKLEK